MAELARSIRGSAPAGRAATAPRGGSVRFRWLVAPAVAAALCGCAVTQPAPPNVDLPPTAAEAVDAAKLPRWWTLFGDPALDRLVDEALAANLDLAAAIARIELARSNVLLAQSNLYPYANLTADGSRSRISGVGSQPLPAGTPLASNSYGVAFEVGYELDLWGKYRSATLAARNDLLASRFGGETVRIAVAADVAATYFRLRAADATLALLVQTRGSRDDAVRLQRDRFEGGITGEYELAQAQAERSAVDADIGRARQAVGLLEGALAVLAGRSPREAFAPEVGRAPASTPLAIVPSLPEGLPSGLIDRRPDIRRAEAVLAASELRVAQARADYFPSISLTGAYGSESAALADLFTSPAAVWRLGAALVQPLIGLRRIDAAVDAAAARRDEAMLAYRQTVQGAFRDVHDALVAHREARAILSAESERRERLTRALETAQLRYEAGRTSFLEVLDAQRLLLSAETQRIAAARDTQLTLVGFAKALGGGWDPAAFAAADATPPRAPARD